MQKLNKIIKKQSKKSAVHLRILKFSQSYPNSITFYSKYICYFSVSLFLTFTSICIGCKSYSIFGNVIEIIVLQYLKQFKSDSRSVPSES